MKARWIDWIIIGLVLWAISPQSMLTLWAGVAALLYGLWRLMTNEGEVVRTAHRLLMDDSSDGSTSVGSSDGVIDEVIDVSARRQIGYGKTKDQARS